MTFRDLKPGDEVLVNNYAIVRVVRVNKRNFVLEGRLNVRFSLVTGYEVKHDGANGYGSTELLTPERRKEFDDSQRRAHLVCLGVNPLREITDLDRLAEIVNGITTEGA